MKLVVTHIDSFAMVYDFNWYLNGQFSQFYKYNSMGIFMFMRRGFEVLGFDSSKPMYGIDINCTYLTSNWTFKCEDVKEKKSRVYWTVVP